MLYTVCPKSNVSDFIVKQLYAGAYPDRLGSVKGEISSQTSDCSIVSTDENMTRVRDLCDPLPGRFKGANDFPNAPQS